MIAIKMREHCGSLPLASLPTKFFELKLLRFVYFNYIAMCIFSRFNFIFYFEIFKIINFLIFFKNLCDLIFLTTLYAHKLNRIEEENNIN